MTGKEDATRRLDGLNSKACLPPVRDGDLFTALFAAALIEGLSTEAALGRAVSGTYAVLEETERLRSYEMALVASAERILRPGRQFAATAIPPRSEASVSPIAPATQ
jgi:pyridoxal/pyridoxine/pyridoxamine kinase